MQVTGKLLLSSAEGILKDRKQEESEVNGAKSNKNAGGSSPSVSAISQTSVESRLLDLQNTIAELQKNYSREQARLSYLKQSPGEINGDLKFDGNQLFPEYGTYFDPESTLNRVTDQMNHLIQTLRKTQVEMENIHALKFAHSDAPQIKASIHVNSDAVKELNPERVARLTR